METRIFVPLNRLMVIEDTWQRISGRSKNTPIHSLRAVALQVKAQAPADFVGIPLFEGEAHRPVAGNLELRKTIGSGKHLVLERAPTSGLLLTLRKSLLGCPGVREGRSIWKEHRLSGTVYTTCTSRARHRLHCFASTTVCKVRKHQFQYFYLAETHTHTHSR